MGGCRCTFRECTNNSINSSGKHFFHFPYKDNERCKKWALNSNKIAFLKLPWTQLRNKTVCEDHFSDASFMNYKKERLTKSAVPSIYRTKDGKNQECELDEGMLAAVEYNFKDKVNDEKSIDLPNENTVAPEQQLQLNQTSSPQQQPSRYSLKVGIDGLENDNETTLILSEWHEPESSVSKAVKAKPIVNDNRKPTVLNSSCQKRVKRFSVREFQEKAKIRRVVIKSEPHAIPESLSNDIEIEESASKVVSKTYGKQSATNTVAAHEPPNEIAVNMQCDGDMALVEIGAAHTPVKTKNEQEQNSKTVDLSKCMELMAEQVKQIGDLNKLLAETQLAKKEAPNQSSSSSTSSSTSTISSDVRHIRVEKGPAMTKVQLFNGIRKYLNPSMVALLRMEMVNIFFFNC